MRLFYILLFLFCLAEPIFAKILVQGHRGSRMTHPENTIPAFEEALLAGADILELDLALTKDNHLVVAHDPYINPLICLDPEKKRFTEKPIIYHMTLEAVKKYDCGSLVNPRFPKQKIFPNTSIPTLEEVLELAKKNYPNMQFNIETKIFPKYPDITPTPEIFVKNILDTIKKYNVEKRVIVQSFDYRTIEKIKKINPNIRTAMLYSDKPVDIIATADTLNVEIISPKHVWVTKKMVQELQHKGIQVAPWTANTKKDWDRLIEMGVDSIITDSPRELIQYLKEKKLRD